MPRVPKTSTISNPKRKGYDVVLDDLLFRAAIGPGREMTISTAEFPNQQVNLKANPEDITTNIGQIYSRSNFSGGQGLDTAHRRNAKEDDVIRFFDSKGVDVFHGDDETSYNIHLLHQTADQNVRGASTSFSDNNNYLAQTTDGTIWITDATSVWYSADAESWTEIDSTVNGATHNFTGIATFGNNLYLTTKDGTSSSQLIYYNGSTWTELNNSQTSNGGLTGIWFVKNTLWITGNDGTAEHVWDINPFDSWSASNLAVADAIIEVEPTHRITDIIDAGAVVLASSTDGNIYSFKLESGIFVNKGQSTIPFEEVHSLAASEGIIFFGTKENTRNIGRLYRAELVAADDLYVLANRQLIKEWAVDSINTTPTSMFASRDSVYIGVQEGTNETNLWRYYLPTGGLARDLQTTGTGPICGITQTGGMFVMVSMGSDVYKEQSTYEENGYIILPNADFFTSEDKQWVGVEVEHDELSEGKAVNIFVSTEYDTIDNPDDTRWELIGQSVTGTGNVEYQLNRNARYINAKIVLESNVTNTESPEFRTVSIRALPRPELVVVTIPINLSDQIERPNRKAFTVKNLGEVIYQELKNKEGDSVTLQLFEPSEIIRGVVESVQYPISEKSEVGSVTQYCLLRVRGVRAEDAATIVTRLLGVGQLGVAGLG